MTDFINKITFKDLKKIIPGLREDFFNGRRGRLSWVVIFRLALKNLLYGKTRTAVTVAAIAVGAGAIVFLVSFGYGLQEIVTNRLVMPNSLRLADVQSDSTALSLSRDKAKEIRNIEGVEDFRVSVSLAGSLSMNGSRMDVVVIGTDNKFLEYSHLYPVAGSFFSGEAEAAYSASCKGSNCRSEIEELLSFIEKGAVAGASEELSSVTDGDPLDAQQKKMRFRLDEDRYVPVRSAPRTTGTIIGYTRGELFESHEGQEVWGSSYDSVDTKGKAIQDSKGDWHGRWVRASMPLWNKVTEDVYEPQKGEDGSQKYGDGYMSENNLKILSPDEIASERRVNELIQKQAAGTVLGESTGSASVLTVSDDSQASEASALKELLSVRTQEKIASSSMHLGLVEVKKEGGKEVIVSTGFLKMLKIEPAKIIGKKLQLEYIISGGVIQGVSGRIVSRPVGYTVRGVVKDDKKSYVFTPISDVESMGVKKYTQGKVLAKSAPELTKVRERVEKLGFVTSSIVDTLAQVNRLFSIMRFLLGTFGMIAFIVAIFGMFNTLTVSLLERTREIAVMKTLGTTDTDVVRLFMVESLILGMLGGFVGIEFGKGLGQLVAWVFLLFQNDKTIILFRTPLSFIFLVFVLSTVVGLLTGIFPSQRAKRISALDALRYE